MWCQPLIKSHGCASVGIKLAILATGVRTKSLVMKGQEAKIMYKYGGGDKPKKNKSKKVKGSSILR